MCEINLVFSNKEKRIHSTWENTGFVHSQSQIYTLLKVHCMGNKLPQMVDFFFLLEMDFLN